jgi:hypothetical protein
MSEIINYSIFGEIGKKKTNLGEFEAPLHIIRKLLYILHSEQRTIKEFFAQLFLGRFKERILYQKADRISTRLGSQDGVLTHIHRRWRIC